MKITKPEATMLLIALLLATLMVCLYPSYLERQLRVNVEECNKVKTLFPNTVYTDGCYTPVGNGIWMKHRGGGELYTTEEVFKGGKQ